MCDNCRTRMSPETDPDAYMDVDDIESFKFSTFVNREFFEVIDDLEEYEESIDRYGSTGVNMYFSEDPELDSDSAWTMTEYDVEPKEWDSFDYQTSERERVRPEGVD